MALKEALITSTHNICICGEIKQNLSILSSAFETMVFSPYNMGKEDYFG